MKTAKDSKYLHLPHLGKTLTMAVAQHLMSNPSIAESLDMVDVDLLKENFDLPFVKDIYTIWQKANSFAGLTGGTVTKFDPEVAKRVKKNGGRYGGESTFAKSVNKASKEAMSTDDHVKGMWADRMKNVPNRGKYMKGGFVKIALDVINKEMPRILKLPRSGTALAAFLCVCENLHIVNDLPVCTLSAGTIADKVGSDVSNVKKALKSLEEIGLIARQKVGRGYHTAIDPYLAYKEDFKTIQQHHEKFKEFSKQG